MIILYGMENIYNLIKYGPNGEPTPEPTTNFTNVEQNQKI